MPRELNGYRENLALLNARFPNYDMLTMEEVMAFTNIKSKATIKKYMGERFRSGKISKHYVALFACGGQ